MKDRMHLLIGDDGKATLYDDTYDIIIHCESEEEQAAVIAKLKSMDWIPVNERLPEEGQIVLATHLGGLDPSRQVIEHIYSGGKFLLNWEMDMEMLSPTFGQRYMGEVIAWMPLPDPWKEGDEE